MGVGGELEKVKVTNKLAELIENTQKRMANHEIVANYNNIAKDWKSLIDLDTLIKALYIGYEVEPEFKPNDVVVYADGKIGLYLPVPKGYSHQMPVRHATPEEIEKEKERRKWAEIGREVNEWKEGDIIERADGELMEITRIDINTSGHRFPFIDFVQSTIEDLNEHFILVCPAEKRFDV